MHSKYEFKGIQFINHGMKEQFAHIIKHVFQMPEHIFDY